MRKYLGAVVAALALVGGALASRAVDAARASAARAETGRAAVQAVQNGADTLAAVVADVREKVAHAAVHPRLALALQGNVDERTMRDLWRTELWWRPWRSEFEVYALAMGGVRLDVVEGMEAAELDSETLLRHVREQGEHAAEIVLGRGRAYAAGAAAIKVPGREKAALLLLAKPVDASTLAGRRSVQGPGEGGALILTDGRAVLIGVGHPSERELLLGAIGSEHAGPVFRPRAGGWMAASSAVAPGVWLWAFASAELPERAARATARNRLAVVWISALLVAASALVLSARRRSAALIAPPLANTAVESSARNLSAPWGAASNARPVDLGATEAIPALGPRGDPSGKVAEYSPPMAAGKPSTTQLTAGASPRGPSVYHRGALPVPAADGGGTGSGSGAAFGRYTLLDRLGEGGMAEVYTAVTFGAEGFRRRFVVKRLRRELARDQAAVDQFIDEANLASSMVHSNIVPVFDFGKVGDEYFIAQEYILGRDLARVTRRSVERDGRPLPCPVVLHAAHETLKALEYAHRKKGEKGNSMGIVHRDVSPSNVIISARGEVKLFDFGIVKSEGRVTRTESGIVKGNVIFMSPEQARGGAVDGRADLFSLGLMLYYCLTGQVLYTGNTTYELLVKAASGPGPDEFNQLRAVPEPCDAILRRALQVRCEDRFQTAREFGDAVAAAANLDAAADQLADLMGHLFGDDFREEEDRFRTLVPAGATTATGTGPGTTDAKLPHRT